FRSWTSDRIIRHASFQGLRQDKPAEEVVQEKPSKADGKAEAKSGSGKTTPKASAAAAMTSIKLSHSDTLLSPDEKVSKQDLHHRRIGKPGPDHPGPRSRRRCRRQSSAHGGGRHPQAARRAVAAGPRQDLPRQGLSRAGAA